MPYWFDGNNLIGHSARTARLQSLTRRAFLQYLAGVVRSGGGHFLVFFDGDDSDRTAPPRGVRVRYCAPLSADEAMVQSLAGVKVPSEVIVVTNDSALQRRCREAGARIRSWGEFEALQSRRRKAGTERHRPAEPVDVADWQRYFGLDDDELEQQ